MRCKKTWTATLTIEDEPAGNEDFLSKEEILKQFDDLDLDAGLRLGSVEVEES